MNRWIHAAGLLVFTALAATACDDGTSPAADFDPQGAAETMQSMTSAVETESLGDAFGSLQNASMLFNGAMAEVVAQSPTAADVQALRDADVAADVIPNEFNGNTYVWNPDSMRYVVGDGTGAPVNGVRVIFYAIDPTTGMPAAPLNELGYVDLDDQSTQASNRLGITIFRNADEVTLADYYLDLAFSLTQSSLDYDIASVGYLANGTDQLNFDLSQGMSITQSLLTIEQAYDLDLEGTDRAMSFTATMTGDPQSESDGPATMDAEALISNGSRTVSVDISFADNVLDGTISDNGTAVVSIAGTLDQPIFTDSDGNELTQQQLSALNALWNALGEMFDFVEELFGFLSI
jgi:hypothetical protein